MARNVTELERPNDVPSKIGKYVIINKVGKGSTGTVFLSHDPYYRRDVAIKVYNIENDQDEDRAKVSRKMFFRLMDIWKPWPIRDLDHRLTGGPGIMLDDLVAALYAAILLGFGGWLFG